VTRRVARLLTMLAGLGASDALLVDIYLYRSGSTASTWWCGKPRTM
jgi:hypothetical protein